jgi:ATP-binding cassette subfamily C (CFTR/MRP) protein 1
MTVLMLWLNCFADREPRDYDPRLANQVKPSPYFKASFPSKATFDFMTPLLWTGFRRPLVNEDLWQLEPEHTAAELGPAFQAHLFKEDDSGPVSLLPALLLSYGSPFFIGTSVKILADMLALVSPQSEFENIFLND